MKNKELDFEIKRPKSEKVNLRFVFVKTTGTLTIRTLVNPEGINLNCKLFSEKAQR